MPFKDSKREKEYSWCRLFISLNYRQIYWELSTFSIRILMYKEATLQMQRLNTMEGH